MYSLRFRKRKGGEILYLDKPNSKQGKKGGKEKKKVGPNPIQHVTKKGRGKKKEQKTI